MNLEPATLRALELGSEDAKDGNVAAHAYRLAYSNDRDPFAGINLGWTDQEASTDFLCACVSAVDELVSEGRLEDWDDLSGELADSAVPIYNRSRVLAALDLSAEVDDPGLLGEDLSLAHIAGVALYCEAQTIMGALVEAIREQDRGDTLG